MPTQTIQPKVVPPPVPGGMFRLPNGRNVTFTFILVSSLFGLWGLCNGMIDVMDKLFQDQLHLTLSQSANVQFAHYLGYFLMALPAGWLAIKMGYKGGLIAGLLLVAVGGFWFIEASHLSKLPTITPKQAFLAYLLGVCVLASGLTFLETIANPYTTVLGDPKFAAARINLAQSTNGVGWILGPIVGGIFFYAKDAAGKSSSVDLWKPYAAIGVIVVILAVVFAFSPMPDVKVEDEYHLDDDDANAKSGTHRSIWTHSHFVMAVGAQFLYVAAQAGIFSFFINYMTSQVPALPKAWETSWLNTKFSVFEIGKLDNLLHISNQGAAYLASIGFFFFLGGRFSGALLLKRYKAPQMLGLYGALNVLVCLVIFAKLGWVSVAAVFLSYFFMSIMFPTIFALGIHGLGVRAKRASGYIVMAIMGGAILPKLMGYAGQTHDMSFAFIVPLASFAFVAFYGFAWPKLRETESPNAVGFILSGIVGAIAAIPVSYFFQPAAVKAFWSFPMYIAENFQAIVPFFPSVEKVPENAGVLVGTVLGSIVICIAACLVACKVVVSILPKKQ